MFFKNPQKHKKSGWRVRLPTTGQTRLRSSPTGIESEAKAQAKACAT